MSRFKIYLTKRLFIINLFSILLFSCFSNSTESNNREYNLYSQIMCPVCDGQTIAESQASIAEDMKNMIRIQIFEEKTDVEILEYFKKRYGQEILSKPPPKGFNLTAWIVPIAILIGSSILLIYSLQKNMERAQK